MTGTAINAITKNKLTGQAVYPYADSNIAIAGANKLGGIKIGGGLDIALDGTASLDTDYLGSVFPDFDLLSPALTYTYTLSDANAHQIWSRANTGLPTDASIVDELGDTAWYRITVSSGTTVKSITDFVLEFTGKAGACPVLWWKNRSYANTLATSGLYQSVLSYPKTINSGKVYEHAIKNYDSTSRTVKVEVFKASGEIEFNSAATATAYQSSYHNQNSYTLHGVTGYGYQGQNFAAISEYANEAYKANYVDTFLAKSLGTLPSAGEALSADTLCFLGTDNLLYNISNTSKAINCNIGLAFSAGATSSGSSPSMTNLRKQGTWTSIGTSHATLAKGTPVYLRCTLSNGAVYSDNYLSTSMAAGYTWAKVGVAYSSSAIAYMLDDIVFFTLNSNGNITAVNGISLAGGGSSASIATTTSPGIVMPDGDSISLNTTTGAIAVDWSKVGTINSSTWT